MNAPEWSIEIEREARPHRRPALTNKVLRGLRTLSTAHRRQMATYELAPGQQGDVKRAIEWIAATHEWWVSERKGRKP